MKPFNLEQALAGEPVRLRDGTKAYVKYEMPDDYEGDYPIMGFYKYRGEYAQCSWTIDGKYNTEHKTSNEDIISMWEEPRPRVQLDLPAPLKAPQENMWYAVIKPIFTEKEDDCGTYVLDTNLYFATKEDAEEWLNALKGARR